MKFEDIKNGTIFSIKNSNKLFIKVTSEYANDYEGVRSFISLNETVLDAQFNLNSQNEQFENTTECEMGDLDNFSVFSLGREKFIKTKPGSTSVSSCIDQDGYLRNISGDEIVDIPQL